ncbi:hypothetical protein K491DRAFT_714833 [Lophiostoma macrostomum CBS 122681]|uniref:Calcofluor white hypersensitive protein n=1 Tax=Lophiostoma macrostomum CBS 122681 TaxID=1314788 RepID=A0A6A6TDY5_9PLEO|nr:hypothetical protein K491DRAFT_714833 [Lophiostoma macrostomum CBS 122681]
MSRRLLTTVGVGAAGIGGYYLYSAGGNPKLAEKQLEHDAATAARKVKGDFPGQDKEAKKAGEEGLEAIKAKADQLGQEFKHQGDVADKRLSQATSDAQKRLAETRQEVGQKVDKAADQFDKKVHEGVSQSKSWLGSWFGGK